MHLYLADFKKLLRLLNIWQRVKVLVTQPYLTLWDPKGAGKHGQTQGGVDGNKKGKAGEGAQLHV